MPNFFKNPNECKLIYNKGLQKKADFAVQKTNPIQTQFQNPAPKQREEKKPLREAAEQAIIFFPVAKPANATLYSENTPVRDA